MATFCAGSAQTRRGCFLAPPSPKRKGSTCRLSDVLLNCVGSVCGSMSWPWSEPHTGLPLQIIAQAEPIKWRCPTCQQALPSNDINDYQPNRFALGVLEAMDAARVRALKNRDIAVGVALGVQDGEGAFGDAGGENQQEDGEAMLPEEAQLPDGWPQTCAQFDILELGGTLQRFQAQQDVVARHRNGLVSSGAPRASCRLLRSRSARLRTHAQLQLRTQTSLLLHTRIMAWRTQTDAAVPASPLRHHPSAITGGCDARRSAPPSRCRLWPGALTTSHLCRCCNAARLLALPEAARSSRCC